MMHLKAGGLGLLAVVLSLASASAQLVVIEEHVFEVSPVSTPWDISLMAPYYDPAEHGGVPLAEVMVMLEGEADSSVDVTATGGDVVVLEGDVGAFITATGLINGLAVDVLPKGVFAPPVINVPNGTTLNLTDVSGYDMDFLAISDPADVSGFEGTGTYEVTLESIGTSTLSTSGGNMDASQRTEATARLRVQYKVLPVPEPAAWAFLVMGLVGIHWLRRR